MEYLWAPWRMEYITSEKSGDCIFCGIPESATARLERLIVHVGRLCFVILNRYPYTSGHLMVAPLRHTSDYTSLRVEEHAEMGLLLRGAIRILDAEYRPEGYNLGMNLGKVAGAGIRDHLHMHLVPRWSGDSNFLPVIGDARCLPELLSETAARLAPRFEELARRGEFDLCGGDSQTGGPPALSSGRERKEGGRS